MNTIRSALMLVLLTFAGISAGGKLPVCGSAQHGKALQRLADSLSSDETKEEVRNMIPFINTFFHTYADTIITKRTFDNELYWQPKKLKKSFNKVRNEFAKLLELCFHCRNGKAWLNKYDKTKKLDFKRRKYSDFGGTLQLLEQVALLLNHGYDLEDKPH